MIGENKMPSENILYSTPQGDSKIEVFFQDDYFWLTPKRMADLFGVEENKVNYHLKEISKTRELAEDSVIRKIRTTADYGKNYLSESCGQFCRTYPIANTLYSQLN